MTCLVSTILYEEEKNSAIYDILNVFDSKIKYLFFIFRMDIFIFYIEAFPLSLRYVNIIEYVLSNYLSCT